MGSAPEPKSLLRAVLGVVSLLSSLVLIPIGMVLLIADTRDGGAGLARPLGVLATGGALLALGVAMLIWEVSVRYGIRR